MSDRPPTTAPTESIVAVDATLPAALRIRRPADFRRVYNRRRSVSNERLCVCGAENGLAHPRLGLSVSRKVGGAVERNRWKRRLREAFRLSKANLPIGYDLVLIPRCTDAPPMETLRADLVDLARRLAKRLRSERRPR